MAGIGIFLRQAREKMGYTLEDMNQITNIHTEYLYALENDQFDQLPSPFYARAFLRTYAKSLGLETQPLLDLLERLYPNTAATDQRYSTPQSSLAPEGNDFSNTRKPRASLLTTAPGSSHQISSRMPAASAPNHHEVEEQAVKWNKPVSTETLRTTPTQSTLSNLPKPDFSKQTLSPRRVALEAKQGLANQAETLTKRGKKAFPKLAVAVAVGALVLVGGGYGAYSSFMADDSPKAVQEKSSEDETPTGLDVSANPQTGPVLEEGGTAENAYEGQLFIIKNVDKLEVQLKAKKGESKVFYAPTPSGQHKSFTMRIGEIKTLDTAGQNQIWFRLGTPSNIEITVNGQPIDTSAQDTEKSYRVQLKK